MKKILALTLFLTLFVLNCEESEIIDSYNCRTADKEGCTSCYSDSYLSKSSKCVPYPSHCNVYHPTGGCLGCDIGYYLDASQTCQKGSKSNPCRPGYEYVEGVCRSVSTDSNCEGFDLSNACSSCKEGFYLDDNKKCQALTTPDCKTGNKYECTNCYAGFYLTSEKECKTNPPNCRRADTNGICYECRWTFELKADKTCQPLKTANCIKENEDGCTRCLPYFYLTPEKQCEAFPSNCLISYKRGECSVCFDDYKLDAEGKCIPK